MQVVNSTPTHEDLDVESHGGMTTCSSLTFSSVESKSPDLSYFEVRESTRLDLITAICVFLLTWTDSRRSRMWRISCLKNERNLNQTILIGSENEHHVQYIEFVCYMLLRLAALSWPRL